MKYFAVVCKYLNMVSHIHMLTNCIVFRSILLRRISMMPPGRIDLELMSSGRDKNILTKDLTMCYTMCQCWCFVCVEK